MLARGSIGNSYLTFGLFSPILRIVIFLSPNIAASGEATTLAGTGSGFSPPSGKTTSDWVNGRRWDDENSLDIVTIGNNQYTILGWSLRAIPEGVSNGQQFEFRLLADETTLTNYSQIPRWTIGTPGGGAVEFVFAVVI